MDLEDYLHDLGLKKWEKAVLGVALISLLFSSYMLISGIALRHYFWPTTTDTMFSRPIGKVEIAFNHTSRQGYNNPDFISLKQNDPVFLMDTIMSGPSSALKLTLRNGSVIELGENSMIRLSFDTNLKLARLNRETIIEVVTGTVSGQGAGNEAVTIKAKNQIFQTSGEKPILISKKGIDLSPKAEQVGLARKTQEKVERERERERENLETETISKTLEPAPADPNMTAISRSYEKMGGVMTSTSPESKPISLADMYAKMKKVDGSEKLQDVPGEPRRKDGSKDISQNESVRPDVIPITKESQELLALFDKPRKTKLEAAKITELQPKDNFLVRQETVPVKFSWKSKPEQMSYKVTFTRNGATEIEKNISTKNENVEFEVSLKKAGSYIWRIEDRNGAILSIRTIHVRTKPQIVQIADPVLIGREDSARVRRTSDLRALSFKWKPIKNVRDYVVRITRNGEQNKPAVVTRTTSKAEFMLPFRRGWPAERLFLSVEAKRADGKIAFSKTIPFMFTILPPRPAFPINKSTISRTSLPEGALNLSVATTSKSEFLTFEIAYDKEFRQIVERETVKSSSYRFYPDDSEVFFWRVRGENSGISSPYSDTMEFTLK